MLALGIDLAKGKTGLVVLATHADASGAILGHDLEVRVERVISPKEQHTYERYRKIVWEIMGVIQAEKPDRVVVEGYSLGRNANATIPLCEVGGILRLMLHIDKVRWLEPKASQVKQFTTGKGNSQKSKMMMEVLDRWGHKSTDDNTADAYACAMIGLAHAGAVKMNLVQRKIVGELAIRD